MLDDVKSVLKKIKAKEGEYLVSCFYNDGSWNIDYYNKDTKKMTSYTEVNGEIKSKIDEVFRKETNNIESLDITKVKVGRLEALDLSGIQGNKIMIILQVIKGKILWNITGVTSTLEVHNVRIDAVTKEKVQEKKESIFSFKK
jgi:hypothetical protein